MVLMAVYFVFQQLCLRFCDFVESKSVWDFGAHTKLPSVSILQLLVTLEFVREFLADWKQLTVCMLYFAFAAADRKD